MYVYVQADVYAYAYACVYLSKCAARIPATALAAGSGACAKISVAYGILRQYTRTGPWKTGTKDKVPGIVLGDFAERVFKKQKITIGISVSISKNTNLHWILIENI